MQFFFPDRQQIQPDYSETARYLGYKKSLPPQEDVEKLINDCMKEMHPFITPKSVFEIFPLKIEDDVKISFADLSFESVDLARNLKGCTQVAIFAATIGPQVDSLIRRYQMVDTVKAAVFQSVGAMYIEVFVNLLNEQIKQIALSENKMCRPRFSPGYGDVSLQMQKEFFRLLPCSKIGLSLMDTLIMSPEKSVTAFVGILPE